MLVGTRLGPYEILSALGAGGMGEVYKARDVRLDRTVAVKILPDALAADPAFRTRFEREARSIAALDHPNICALFDVGTEEARAYLVMPFVDGEPLTVRIGRGPLAVTDAVAIAARSPRHSTPHTSAASSTAISKPANVMIGRDGHVKVLDFGLAKDDAAGIRTLTDASASPTMSRNVTARGRDSRHGRLHGPRAGARRSRSTSARTFGRGVRTVRDARGSLSV